MQKGEPGSPFCSFAVSPAALLAVAAARPYLGGTQVPLVTQSSESRPSEPIFNVPPVVIATMAVLALVHGFRVFVLSDAADQQFLLTFAFIPARYGTVVPAGIPGGFGADLWSFFSYAFLHDDALHIGLNLAWLLPFGTALARRFGALRYVMFMLVTAAAGALAHLATHAGDPVPMIGASAAISGAMAAAMRFIFQEHGPLEMWREGIGDGRAYRVPAMPLLATFRDLRFLMFLVTWIGLNLLIGLGTVSLGEAGQQVAWQAHIGGFLAGLLLFTAFDPAVPSAELDVEPSG